MKIVTIVGIKQILPFRFEQQYTAFSALQGSMPLIHIIQVPHHHSSGVKYLSSLVLIVDTASSWFGLEFIHFSFIFLFYFIIRDASRPTAPGASSEASSPRAGQATSGATTTPPVLGAGPRTQKPPSGNKKGRKKKGSKW